MLIGSATACALAHAVAHACHPAGARSYGYGNRMAVVSPQVHGLMVTVASTAHLYIMRKSRQRLQNVLDRAKRLAEVRLPRKSGRSGRCTICKILG